MHSYRPLNVAVSVIVCVLGISGICLPFPVPSSMASETVCTPADRFLEWQKKLDAALEEIDCLHKKLACEKDETMKTLEELRRLMEKIDRRKAVFSSLPQTEETRKEIMKDISNLKKLMKNLTEKSNGMVGSSRNSSRNIAMALRGCLDSTRTLYLLYLDELRSEFDSIKPEKKEKNKKTTRGKVEGQTVKVEKSGDTDENGGCETSEVSAP